MKFQKLMFSTITAFAFALSACAPSTPGDAMMAKPTDAMMAQPTDAMMAKPTDAMMSSTATPDMMMHDTPTPDGMMHDTATPDAMMAAPMWFSTPFTDTASGAAFKIDDYKGKVVLVETMAVWCTNCKAQQDQIKALNESLGMPAEPVVISLDIDPHENNDVLKAYVAQSNFHWTFAVAPAAVSAEIGTLYGDQFLNPTSTPMLVIDRKGNVHLLPFGIKSSDDLMKAIQPYLNGM